MLATTLSYNKYDDFGTPQSLPCSVVSDVAFEGLKWRVEVKKANWLKSQVALNLVSWNPFHFFLGVRVQSFGGCSGSDPPALVLGTLSLGSGRPS